MATATKARCEALAKAHGIKIELEWLSGSYSYWLTIPSNKIMDDGCTGRTEHDLFMPKAQVWGLLMGDLKNILQHDWLDA